VTPAGGTVVFAGVIAADYPVVQAFRKGLMSAGFDVLLALGTPGRSTIRNAMALRAKLSRIPTRSGDAVLLLPFSHPMAPVVYSWARWRRLRVLCAPQISLFHNAVYARCECTVGSVRARRYRLYDRLALQGADVIIACARAYGELLTRLYSLNPANVFTIYDGYDDELWRPRAAAARGAEFIVHWSLAFLPTHGVETVLGAAERLKHLPQVRFELYGDGQTRPAVEQAVAARRLSNVVLHPRQPIARLPDIVAKSDVCLGAFGSDEKAGLMIPLKIFQAMAMRKVVVTADQPAMREVFVPDRDFVGVRAGRPDDLAAALVRLCENPSLCADIGETGRAAVQRFRTSEIGRELARLVAGVSPKP
jgi:glycosyltransferase involved in cell wall biosynthesis